MTDIQKLVCKQVYSIINKTFFQPTSHHRFFSQASGTNEAGTHAQELTSGNLNLPFVVKKYKKNIKIKRKNQRTTENKKKQLGSPWIFL